MCLIVDTCCISNVFDSNNQNHPEFEPVMMWITEGKGKLIYGGTKYKSELRRAPKYLKLLVELSRQGRVIEIEDCKVDEKEEEVKRIESHRDFDDPHLVALVIVSRCRIICTNDKRAHRFIRQTNIYPRGVSRPSIYSSARHVNLLVDKNIVGVCK